MVCALPRLAQAQTLRSHDSTGSRPLPSQRALPRCRANGEFKPPQRWRCPGSQKMVCQVPPDGYKKVPIVQVVVYFFGPGPNSGYRQRYARSPSAGPPPSPRPPPPSGPAKNREEHSESMFCSEMVPGGRRGTRSPAAQGGKRGERGERLPASVGDSSRRPNPCAPAPPHPQRQKVKPLFAVKMRSLVLPLNRTGFLLESQRPKLIWDLAGSFWDRHQTPFHYPSRRNGIALQL